MYTFVVNPASGHGQGKLTMSKIAALLNKKAIDYRIIFTNPQRTAKDVAAELSSNYNKNEPQKKVVLVGGDGSFYEFLNGIDDFDSLAVGFIAAGRGNDFVRNLKPDKNPQKEMERILKATPQKCDFIQCGNLRSLNVAGTGLDVEVLLAVERVRSTNKLSYLNALVNALRKFDPYDVTVELNGMTLERSVIMVGVCNGTSFGGGIKLSPNSVIDDGKLHVVIISIPKNGKIFPVLPKFVKGKHIDMEFTEEFVCQSVRVINKKTEFASELDGEIQNNFPLDCKVVSGKLNILR